MDKSKRYENFPLRTVILSGLFSLLVYGSGFFITLQAGWIVSFLYLMYILFLEYRLIRKHCINCYYWGKTCGFGKGRISSLFFEKGDVSKFCKTEMKWKDMIPDLLIPAIPLIIGIVLLISKFDIILLFVMIVLIILSTTGNGFIRGTLTCKYCKQKELGCPADRLFNKDK